MAAKRITAAVVEAMVPGETVWDSEVRGFGIRLRARDRVYLLKARIGGRQRIMTIGQHSRGEWGAESARREAQRLLGLIRGGKDPAAERDQAKAAPTLAVFAARFLAEYSAVHHKPRSRVEIAGLVRRYLIKPPLGTMKLRDIGRADVARMHAGLHHVPVAANRALAVLSAMFGWAERIGELRDGANPCRHVDRFPEKPRERMLSAGELARLGEALEHAARPWSAEDRAAWRQMCEAHAADAIAEAARARWIADRQPRRMTAEDWRVIAAVRLLIFTGARVSEVLTLRWEWIDASAGVARLPDSKTGAKNLYLPPGALAVLEALPRFVGNPFVLPGARPAAPFVGIGKPWQRIRALAGLPDLRIHDLRHAFASVAVAAGDSLFIVGKLLGHHSAATTARYAHLAPDPAKAVADRTGERIRAMLAGEGGSVVPLPPRRRG